MFFHGLKYKRLYSQLVAIQPEANDNTRRHGGQERLVPEGFSRKGVGDMHFDDRRCYRFHGIGNANGGVCIGPGIQYDAIVAKAFFLYFGYYFSFNIALEVRQLYAGVFILQSGEIVIKSPAAVYFGFARA